MRWGQIENDPTCISAPRIFIKYKLHWDGVGSNFIVSLLYAKRKWNCGAETLKKI